MDQIKELDIEFLLDKSGSMNTADCPGGKTRWQFAQETTLALANAVQKYDDNGITVVPFASQMKVYESVTPAKVAQVFAEQSPMGSTNTALVLENRLTAYLERRRTGTAKPLLLIVLTDGEPDDGDAVSRVIVAATKQIESDNEIAIQFVQIGNDPGAEKFLKHLDDNLVATNGAKFDIVDTTKLADIENMTMEEFILKSFND